MYQFSLFQLVLLVLLFLFPLLTIFWKNFKTQKSSASKLPPGPWKLPLVGNLHQLVGSPLPHRSFRDMSRKYGPVMKLELGEALTIIVSSVEAAKEVLQTHELSFAQRPTTIGVDAVAYDHPGLIFAPYGEYWRQMRKICVMELLSAKRVQSFKSVREEEAWRLTESISSYASKQGPINISKMVFSVTNAMVARAAFHKKCKDEDQFIASLKVLVTDSTGLTVPDCFPSIKFLSYITGLKSRLVTMQKNLHRILDDIIAEHKMTAQSTSKVVSDDDEQDLVDVLLNLQKSNDQKFEITTNHLKLVILDILAAGSETAATTLEWAMSELVKNPKVLEKAQTEVRQVLGRKGKVEEEDIQKLEYLKCIVKETLRLHTPVPFVARQSRETCEILGYKIPAKVRIAVNAWALGRDPEVWDNAEWYQPERFIGSSIDLRGTNFEFLPFGAGRRMCPGISLAFANVELVLAQLLYHFNWELPNGAKGEQLDMSEAYGITCRRKDDLYLVATPVIPFLK